MKPISPIPSAKLPTKGSRSYGVRRGTRLHQGVDIFAPRGTPVLAPAAGRVEHAHEGWARGFSRYGSVVVLRVLGPRWVLLSHLDKVEVQPGEMVKRGQRIGTVGTSAGTRSEPSAQFARSKPHLHWEVSPRPYPQAAAAPRDNPIAWLRTGAEEGRGEALLVLALVTLWMTTKS